MLSVWFYFYFFVHSVIRKWIWRKKNSIFLPDSWKCEFTVEFPVPTNPKSYEFKWKWGKKFRLICMLEYSANWNSFESADSNPIDIYEQEKKKSAKNLISCNSNIVNFLRAILMSDSSVSKWIVMSTLEALHSRPNVIISWSMRQTMSPEWNDRVSISCMLTQTRSSLQRC